MEDYLLNTRDQYYMEGGMRVYNLKEVVVTGSRKKASSESIYTGGINTYTIEGDRLEGFGAQTAFDAVTRLPGISVTNGNEIHIRNNPEQPVIVVDDVVYEDDNDILTMIQTSDMSSLSLLRGADAAILGSRGSAGAIVITLKDGKDIPQDRHRALSHVLHWGTATRSSFIILLMIRLKRRMTNARIYEVRSIGILPFNWMLMEKQPSNTILRTALHRKI